MNTIIRNIIIVFLLFLPLVQLSAQNTLISPYGQHDSRFTLEKNEISQENIKIINADFIPQIEAQRQPGDPLNKTMPAAEVPGKVSYNAVNHEALNAFLNRPKPDEEEMIRQEWERAFGFDVWYPYYKAREIEKIVKKKLTVRIFKLKGEPIFERNRTLYVFKTTF